MKDWSENLHQARVLVLGDVMLDHYMFGQVRRISPEAPVPILETTREDYLLGGAANVAFNLISMGVQVSMVSVIGADAAGRRLLQMLEDSGVESGYVEQTTARPTTIKTRLIAGQQQMLRVDREIRTELSTEEMKALEESLETAIPEHDVVVVSDYGKGLITELMLSCIRRICLNQKKPVICDPKVRDFRRYRQMSCLTPNQAEAELAWGKSLDSLDEVRLAGKTLREEYVLETLLITLGARGMMLFSDKEPVHIATEAREVFDVTGAGDTVISALAACRALGQNWEFSARVANHAAGIVVGKLGAAAPSREEFVCLLKKFD